MPLPTGYYLCSIVGSGGAGLCSNISASVGPTFEPNRVVELTTYFGAMPCLGCSPALWCNGGIPQLANLTLHRERMSRHLAERVKPDFDGIIDVDYESWSPSWNLTSESYRNASRALARTQLPAGASDAAIETKAVADYNAAGLAFMETTLRHVQAYAPRARVGFYGRPTAPYYHYNATLLHKVNEALLPMYNASSVLMPSIYLPYRSGVDTSFANIATFVRDRLAQAADVNAMLVARGEAPKPVVPYAWYRYHDGGPSGLIPLNANDTQLEFAFPGHADNGVTNIIIWGAEDANNLTAINEVSGWFTRNAATFRGDGVAQPPQRTLDVDTAAHGSAMPQRLTTPPFIDPTEPPPPFTACSLSERTAQLENQRLASPWAAHGIGLYDDTPGSPPLAKQLAIASELLGSNGWVVLFLQPVIPGPAPTEAFAAKLRAAYARGLRVIVRLGWAGAMRDYADPGTNATGFRRVAVQIAAVVDALPLPPPESGPLYVHAGNELNACNEWRCTEPANQTLSLDTRAREVAGFMSDTFAGLAALAAVRNGSVWLAHASIADWQTDGCVCGSNAKTGTGRKGTEFLARLRAAKPDLYANVRWISSHSYPYSNANWSSDPSSKAWRGLTYYQAERDALNLSQTLPVAITETGWARNPGTPWSKSDDDQASWMHRAADEIWKRDPSVVAVAPFLLGGRFWEARGWQFVDCPPSNSTDAPCDGELAPRAVFDAWRRAGRML